MNKIILMGRLTKDPEIRHGRGENAVTVARYVLAVDRAQKRGDDKADFFQITAFDKRGEFAEKYLRKGMKMLIIGHVQTGAYDSKDGIRMPSFEVVAEEQEFAEGRHENSPYADSQPEEPHRDKPAGEPEEDNDLYDLPFC